jgi:putative ABC transport system permease protein
MSILRLAFKNIFNKPWSLALSLILFGLGVGLISFLFIVNNQLQDKFDKNLAGIDLVVGAKGSPLQMILASMYHIDAPTGNIPISSAKAFLNPNHPLIKKAIPLSLGDSYRGFRIVGTNHDMVELYEGSIGSGELWEQDFEVTIGSGIAKIMNLAIGDKFHSSHGLVDDENLVHDDAGMFEVVGILAESGSVLDQLILTNTESIWKVHESHDHEEDTAESEKDQHAEDEHDHSTHDHSADDGHNHEHETTEKEEKKPLVEYTDQDITSLLLQFKNRNFQTLNMARNINENTDLQAASPAIEINRLYSMMGVGLDALRMIGWIIAIVSGLSIFISLYNSLKERRFELALMRINGASRMKLFLLIILEGLFLAILGYIFGIFLSHTGAEMFSNFAQSSYKYDFTGMVMQKEDGFLLIGSLMIGLISAIIPAYQAYKTDIAETLRNK